MFNISWLLHGKQIDPGKKEIGSLILQKKKKKVIQRDFDAFKLHLQDRISKTCC